MWCKAQKQICRNFISWSIIFFCSLCDSNWTKYLWILKKYYIYTTRLRFHYVWQIKLFSCKKSLLEKFNGISKLFTDNQVLLFHNMWTLIANTRFTCTVIQIQIFRNANFSPFWFICYWTCAFIPKTSSFTSLQFINLIKIVFELKSTIVVWIYTFYYRPAVPNEI